MCVYKIIIDLKTIKFFRSIRINGIVTRYLKGDAEYLMCPDIEKMITLSSIEFQTAAVKDLSAIFEMREKVRQSKAYEKCPDFWVTFEVEPVYVEFFVQQSDYCADRLRFYNPRFNVRKGFDDETTKEGEDGWFFQRLLP